MNKMNINDNVYVFLTDAGKRILKEKAAWTFLSPVYDEKTGLLCEQLWFIMSVFGPHIWLGMPETLFRKNNVYFNYELFLGIQEGHSNAKSVVLITCGEKT